MFSIGKTSAAAIAALAVIASFSPAEAGRRWSNSNLTTTVTDNGNGNTFIKRQRDPLPSGVTSTATQTGSDNKAVHIQDCNTCTAVTVQSGTGNTSIIKQKQSVTINGTTTIPTSTQTATSIVAE